MRIRNVRSHSTPADPCLSVSAGRFTRPGRSSSAAKLTRIGVIAPLLAFGNVFPGTGGGLNAAWQSEVEKPSTTYQKPTAGARRVEKQPRSWPGPDGKPLPFKSADEVLRYLRDAEVVKMKPIGEGVTGTDQLLLEKDGLRMHAIFRDVHIFKRRETFTDGTVKLNFRDEAIFECAAFELSQLLGLNIVPPVVAKKIKGKGGTVQVWIEGTMMEKERLQKEIQPPDSWRWRMQLQVLTVFDNLIYNEDRNAGNLLITKDWLVVLIDHTRSFRINENLLPSRQIRYCDRNLLENLKALNPQMLEDRLGEWLTGRQLSALLKRRDLIVKHIEGLITEHGENQVLFTFYR